MNGEGGKALHLTVIGCYGPYPPAGGACSGYLLEKDEFKILIDCGSGVLSRLQNFVSLWELDALVLSHLHGEHTSDLTVQRYAIDAASSRGLRTEPLPLYAPPEPKEKFEILRYKDTLRIIPLKAGRPLQIGPFKFDFLSTVHSMLCLAMRIESEHSTLVYTAITFPRWPSLPTERISFGEANLPESRMIAGEFQSHSASQAACWPLRRTWKVQPISWVKIQRSFKGGPETFFKG